MRNEQINEWMWHPEKKCLTYGIPHTYLYCKMIAIAQQLKNEQLRTVGHSEYVRRRRCQRQRIEIRCNSVHSTWILYAMHYVPLSIPLRMCANVYRHLDEYYTIDVCLRKRIMLLLFYSIYKHFYLFDLMELIGRCWAVLCMLLLLLLSELYDWHAIKMIELKSMREKDRKSK